MGYWYMKQHRHISTALRQRPESPTQEAPDFVDSKSRVRWTGVSESCPVRAVGGDGGSARGRVGPP